MVQLTNFGACIMLMLILPNVLAISSWFHHYARKISRLMEYGPATLDLYTQWKKEIPKHDFDRFSSLNKVPVSLGMTAHDFCMTNKGCARLLQSRGIHSREDFLKQIMRWHFTEAGLHIGLNSGALELWLDIAFSLDSGVKLCIAEKPDMESFTVPRLCMTTW